MTIFKIYKIFSKNSEKYFIDYTEKKVLSSVLNKIILNYKTFVLNKNTLFENVFNIIDKNDIGIELLNKFETLDETNIYIDNYKKENENFVSSENEIIHNLKNVNVLKNSNDRKEYLKKYYEKNKNKKKIKTQNKKYYENNKTEIKEKINKINKNKKIIKNTNKSKNILVLLGKDL